jgi:hypothetical protein
MPYIILSPKWLPHLRNITLLQLHVRYLRTELHRLTICINTIIFVELKRFEGESQVTKYSLLLANASLHHRFSSGGGKPYFPLSYRLLYLAANDS